uniref:hypothetical protein n=1 Tax=Klebsiella pneumoniae TaxID=573 RepID=UPI0013D29AB3
EVQHFNKGTQLTFDDLRASLFSVSHIKLPGLDASVIPSSAPSALGTGIGAALAGGNVELAARLGQGPAIRPLPTVEAPLFQGFRVNAPM